MSIEDRLQHIEDQLNRLITIFNDQADSTGKKPVDIYTAAEITGYSIHTLRKHKNEIGFSQRGRKLIFNRECLDNWKAKFTRNPRN